MKNKLSIGVLDSNGFYLPIAISLSKHFDHTYFYSRHEGDFERISQDKIGTGIEGIERISHWLNYIDDIDIFILPALNWEAEGEYLRSIGKKVWGGCQSEQLEKDRILFRKELESCGLPVAKAEIAEGMDDLREKLKGQKDKWIKETQGYRGQTETKHFTSESNQNGFFTNLENDLGGLKNDIKFLICDPIDAVTEVGTDTFCVNGVMPENIITGIEIKDIGFLGKHDTQKNSPKPCQEVNGKFEEVLKKYNHTGAYSTEIRYTKDGISYYTDPTIRFPQPPSFLYIDWITNWYDIITGAVEGKLVEPEFSHKYGAEIILKSSYVCENNLTVSFDKKFADFVKLKASYVRDGVNYVVRMKDVGVEMEQFGSAVGFGETPDAAIANAMKVVETIECDEFNYASDALDKAMKELEKLKLSTGYEF